MSGAQKKHDFPLRIERLFTEDGTDAFDQIHFTSQEMEGDEAVPALAHPHNWRPQAVALLAEEAAQQNIPADTHVSEENTTPSWLWRRVAEGDHTTSETSVAQIFYRVAGAATYAGWKNGIFSDENSAQAFFDELRFLLAQRMIAIEPAMLATIGLDWAYGIEKIETITATTNAHVVFESTDFGKKKSFTPASIRNTSIDMLLGGDKNVRQKWQKFLTSGLQGGALTLRFADIAADWNATPGDTPGLRAAIDLFAFRREDGGIDIDKIGHAARLLTFALELLGESGSIAIGFHNLAPVLLALAMPYDSAAGRATAAALIALVSAEIYAASAHMAALLGPSIDFAANRESIMRHLRNHRRAAYGDQTDYEKVSVLPVPLALDAGADLALIAAVRHRWDEVIDLAHQHGLRRAGTDLAPSPPLAYFMESASQGMEPMRELTYIEATDEDNFRRAIHPAVTEALIRLSYSDEESREIIEHIRGTESLGHAAGIDHAALRERGFTDTELDKIEAYLPYVDEIRLAFTPWILGEDFCRNILKMTGEQINDVRFNILRHLGFSLKDIAAANLYCYGYGTVAGAKNLQPEDLPIFQQTHETKTEARVHMAASLQSFISGDAHLLLTLPPGADVTECERLLLSVWRQGIKSVTIEIDDDAKPAAQPKERAAMPKQVSSYGASLRSSLRSRPKASAELTGIKHADKKSPVDRHSSKKR